MSLSTTTKRWLGCAVLALGALGIYVYTLCPTVYGGDSGELITAVNEFGVVHPPGYPLYTLLGKLFTYLPWGTIAWRVNFLSAVCDAGATAFLFLAVEAWSLSWAGAFLSAGLFAFSALTWRYAVTAEVFALNNLLVSVLMYLFVRFDRKPRALSFYGAAFIVGLGLSNHHTFLFVGLPWLFLMWRRLGARLTGGLAALGAVAVGLLPYAYLPWAAAREPYVSWGAVNTPAGFFIHLLRSEYGSFSLAAAAPTPNLIREGAAYFLRLYQYLRSFFVESVGVGWVLAAFGLRNQSRPDVRRGTLFSWVIYFFLFHALANLDPMDPTNRGVLERFWQLPDLILFAWVGIGFAELERWLRPRRFSAAGAWVVMAVVSLQAVRHFSPENQRDNLIFRDLGRAALESLPPQAWLLTLGDVEFGVTRYAQRVEGVRPDVRIIDQAMLSYPWYAGWMKVHYPEIRLPGDRCYPGVPGDYSIFRFIDENYGKAPIFAFSALSPRQTDPAERALQGKYLSWPVGLSERIFTTSDDFTVESWIEENRRDFSRFRPPHRTVGSARSWDRFVAIKYWGRKRRYIEFLTQLAEQTNSRSLFQIAADLEQDAVEEWGPDAPEEWRNRLGYLRARE